MHANGVRGYAKIEKILCMPKTFGFRAFLKTAFLAGNRYTEQVFKPYGNCGFYCNIIPNAEAYFVCSSFSSVSNSFNRLL